MKNRHLTASLVVTVFAIITLGTGGCKKTTGGGWIPAPGGDGKATFGFNMFCETTDTGNALFTGMVQYNDHYNKVKFHGVGNAMWPDGPMSCEELDALISNEVFGLCGEYRAGPELEGGLFCVGVEDLGEPGPTSEDYFYVEITGGVYDGYINEGVLGGGNVQFHPE